MIEEYSCSESRIEETVSSEEFVSEDEVGGFKFQVQRLI
jgi:hypothetical protein